MAEHTNPRAVRDASAALKAHEEASAFLLDGPAHALAMLLADLLHWCDAQSPRVDFEAAKVVALEMVAEDRA
jgi:hypothetical protein